MKALKRWKGQTNSHPTSDERIQQDQITPCAVTATIRDLETGAADGCDDPLDDSQQNDSESTVAASSATNNLLMAAKRRRLFAFLIVLVGAAASVAFLAFGITSQNRQQTILFQRRANDITNSIEATWAQYELFGLWTQQSCYSPPELNKAGTEIASASYTTGTGSSGAVADNLHICSRKQFQMLFTYMSSLGLNFQAAEIIVNVTHANRAKLEEESREFYRIHHPQVDYNGVVGFLPDDESGGLKLGPQSEQPYYYPVHYALPVEGNEAALDLDLYSHPARRKAILDATNSFKPVITERIRLAQETDPNAFSVLAFHPGVPLDFLPHDSKPSVLSVLVIRIPDLIQAAARDASISTSISIFDSSIQHKDPIFLGGGDILVHDNSTTTVAPQLEQSLAQVLQSASRSEVRTLHIADKEWTIAITASPGTFETSPLFVLLGSSLIFISCIILAVWFFTKMRNLTKLQELKSKAEAEKAALRLEAAQQQAFSERQLNEYIAHEVRNPLSAGISATSFVATAVSKPNISEEERKQIQEDVAIVETSLQFINDLLRSMLDLHRSLDKQLHITLAPTDLKNDILEPVAAILHLRGSKVEVLVDCPENLTVETDKMRVKQIMMNLSANSVKFVDRGYIRLRAQVVDGTVQLNVEDSGPGIPLQKRSNLFGRYQESLDLLSQGTGLGLSLSAAISKLLGGAIWLDESFDCGVEGNVGARFVVDLGVPPMADNDKDSTEHEEAMPSESCQVQANGPESTEPMEAEEEELPEHLSVLFTDDDLIIRRLFCRSIKRIAPSWNVEQASNGETALLMCKEKEFDLVFMDQYMASVSKQLLGTETVRALRAQGVTSKICGLSANNMETEFLQSGADCFSSKPLPGKKEELLKELLRIWNTAASVVDQESNMPPGAMVAADGEEAALMTTTGPA